MPPLPEYPPSEPSDLITLWQGIFGGQGFLAIALATARIADGLPIALATSEYVLMVPFGICLK